jgi:hypothetical protein
MVISVSRSILFHCWHSDDTAAARYVLESICEKGLLLTTNAATLDSFAIDRGKGVVQVEVMQHPRVCFTDIPIELLAEHGQRYGKYGVGFRRETIIDWGGLPAWYLPNYWGDKSLKIAGPVLVNGLHAAMDAAQHLQVLAAEFKAKGVPFTVTYRHGPTMQADQLVNELQQVHIRSLWCCPSSKKCPRSRRKITAICSSGSGALLPGSVLPDSHPLPNIDSG